MRKRNWATSSRKTIQLLHILLQFSTYLCEVNTIQRPSALTRDNASHSNLLATGSIPVVGSSRNTTGGSPTRDIAVLSFLLLPPLGREEINALNVCNISSDLIRLLQIQSKVTMDFFFIFCACMQTIDQKSETETFH